MDIDECVIINHSEEIRNVLGASTEPLTARQIYAQTTSFPDCDRVSRVLYNLSKSGNRVKWIWLVNIPQKKCGKFTLPPVEQRKGLR
jgi:predicted Zn-ribbon and HTH transcriptional regulator